MKIIKTSIINMDGEQAPTRPIISLGSLRDFLTKCLLCVYAVWNLFFRYSQESGEDEPSENYHKDKFSQERGEYIEGFCHQRTLRERRFKLQQLIYRFFQGNSDQHTENRRDTRESEEENNRPVQNETGDIHDMGLRLRIRKGEQASESRPRTDVMVDLISCDPEADRLSQGSNTPATSATGAAESPLSNTSSPLPHVGVDEVGGERDILGSSVMPSPNTRPAETTNPLTPVNKSATSALAVLGQNCPSQLFKPPATQPTSDSGSSSISPTMHIPRSNISTHLDSHVHSASAATECEGAHHEDPPSKTTKPTDDTGPSALVVHLEDKKTSDTPPPLHPTGLREEAGAEGITAGDTSHSFSNPQTNNTHLKSDDAVGKVSPQEGPTGAWKDSPVRGRTFTQMSPVVAAATGGQILKTIDSDETNLKPGGSDREDKPASSRLQASVSDTSSSAAPTLWTDEPRETDKDVHEPTSSSSNGHHDTSIQHPQSDPSAVAASEAASSQPSLPQGLTPEPPEEDNVHSKPESFPSDTVD